MNSSNESAKARQVAPTSSGQICGIVTRQKRTQPLAPRSAAASSSAGSSRSSAADGDQQEVREHVHAVRDDDSRERELDVGAHEEHQQREPDEEAGEGDRKEEQERERPAQAGARPCQAERRQRAQQQCDRRRPEATKRLVSSADRKPGSFSTKSYQRSEKPVNGSESEPVLWNENSTTKTSGTYRNSNAAIVIASEVRERTVMRSAPCRAARAAARRASRSRAPRTPPASAATWRRPVGSCRRS